MSNVKRVFVEKKSDFAVKAKDLEHEIRGYLGIKDIASVRVLIRYDVENVTDETFEKACNGILQNRRWTFCTGGVSGGGRKQSVLRRVSSGAV